MAYQPGDFGADALADILYGKTNPSGRLPFTYPKYEHSLLWYDHKYTETFDAQYGNNAFQPQWPFGHGLSYSSVEYSDLSISKNVLHPNESVEISVTIRNNSDREVKEPVLLFMQDKFASVTPSVKKLIDFNKITLAPNSTQLLRFTIRPEMLRFVDANAKWVIEPGDFDLMIGSLKTTLNYQQP
jgi:beta-glucosidase